MIKGRGTDCNKFVKRENLNKSKMGNQGRGQGKENEPKGTIEIQLDWCSYDCNTRKTPGEEKG